MPNPRVFHDISVEGQPVGRVIFELFADTVPKTAENFRALCTGSQGVNTEGTPLWYKGSPFHRIIAGFMVQGGDFTLRNGKGGESIYGGTFDDEDLKREIDSEGLLVMANRGKNTNGSQFFVSLRPCPHLNGKHVVMGRVVKGYDIIEGLSKLPVNEKDHPVQLVTISHCGELERKAPAKKARSPSPVSDRARSRSRSNSVDSRARSRSRSQSRSRSPSPDRKRSKHHSSSSKRHKSSSSRKHKSSSRRSRRDRTPSSSPELTAEQIAVLEQRKMEEEADVAQKIVEEERRRRDRERQLEEIKRRNQRPVEGGTVYKGRGSMKAPGGGGGGMRGW